MKFSELKNDCFGKVLSLQNFEGVVFFQRLVDAISIYIYIPGSGSPTHTPCHDHGYNSSTRPLLLMLLRVGR